jgi:PAS domain-containing protein
MSRDVCLFQRASIQYIVEVMKDEPGGQIEPGASIVAGAHSSSIGEFDLQLWASHPDALVLVSEGAVVDANPSTEQLYGYRQSWLVGKPAAVLAPLDNLTLRRGSPVFRARRRDGRSFMATASLVPVGKPGAPHLVVVRDVSSLLQWLQTLDIGEPDQLEHLAAREGTIDAGRESVTQNLFGTGLELLACLETDSEPSRELLERVIQALDDAMRDLAESQQ